MDQLDRGARMRPNERRARERLVEDERERDRRYLIAEFDDEADRRRLYATAIMVALVLLVILYGLTRHMSADGSAWGTATDASTLVQPPSWWLTKE